MVTRQTRMMFIRAIFTCFGNRPYMNISKIEQRVLHVLAQGGLIRFERSPNGKLARVDCYTHDGSVLSDCTLEIVSRLRRKRLIESRHSAPYRISALGRRSVRARPDNRTK